MRIAIDDETGRIIADVDDLFDELKKPFEEMPDDAVIGVSDLRRFLQMTQDGLKLAVLDES